jgi:hypothetical protein
MKDFVPYEQTIEIMNLGFIIPGCEMFPTKTIIITALKRISGSDGFRITKKYNGMHTRTVGSKTHSNVLKHGYPP